MSNVFELTFNAPSFALGIATGWAILVLLPQPWSDWLTRQERFGIVLAAAAIAVLVYMVVPDMTWKMLIGIVVFIVLSAGSIIWFWFFHHHSTNNKP